jgi:ribosome-associated protein
MTTETAAKKDIQKLQRAIVDGLEDVKAQDIQVFNTEHLSALFERVIVASGTSNRQTKALAASVRDAVREAGFAKPRMEGEDNGEWIIVDCGAAVVHVMQPNIRQYYHLEDLWGDKPVRLKFGADKPVTAAAKAAPAKPTKEAKPVSTSLKRSNAAKKGVMEAFPSKAQVKKDAAKSTPRPAAKAPVKKAVAKKTVSKPKVIVVGKPAVKSPAKAPTKAVAKVPAKKTVRKTATAKA